MRFKATGNKRDVVAVVIKNGETSATIPAGTPVTLVMSGTDDGVAVVLPSTAGDAKNGAYKYGIALSNMAPGDYGEAQVFGYNANSLVNVLTRAATTASWATFASVQSGVALGWDSVNNALAVNASMAGSLGTLHANAVLASSLAAGTGSASASTDTRTAINVAAKTFIRMMG